jgi:hypothetical protein
MSQVSRLCQSGFGPRNDGTDPILGSFAGLPDGDLLDLIFEGCSFRFQIGYGGDCATGALSGGNDLVLFYTGVSALVPEPAAVTLIALGALALVATRRAS